MREVLGEFGTCCVPGSLGGTVFGRNTAAEPADKKYQTAGIKAGASGSRKNTCDSAIKIFKGESIRPRKMRAAYGSTPRHRLHVGGHPVSQKKTESTRSYN
jgi:hypothetical protein